MIKNVRKGKGYGYKDLATKFVCMIRCFKCGRENYSPAVSSGFCGCCGHNANKAKKKLDNRTGV